MNQNNVYDRLLRPGCFVGMTVPTREALRAGTAKKRLVDDLLKRMQEAGCGVANKPLAKPANKPANSPKPVAKPANSPKPVAKPVNKPANKPVAKPGGFFSLSSKATKKQIENALENIPLKSRGNNYRVALLMAKLAGAAANKKPASKPVANNKKPAGPRGLAAKVQTAAAEPWPDENQFWKLLRAEASEKQFAAMKAANLKRMTAGQRKTYDVLAMKAAKKTRKVKLLADARKAVEKMNTSTEDASNTYYKFTNILNRQNASAPVYIRGGLNPKEYVPLPKPPKASTGLNAKIGTRDNPGQLTQEVISAVNAPWPTESEFKALMFQKATPAQAKVLQQVAEAGGRGGTRDSGVYHNVALKTIKALPKYKDLMTALNKIHKLRLAEHRPDLYQKWTSSINEEFDVKAPKHISFTLALTHESNNGWLANNDNSELTPEERNVNVGGLLATEKNKMKGQEKSEEVLENQRKMLKKSIEKMLQKYKETVKNAEARHAAGKASNSQFVRAGKLLAEIVDFEQSAGVPMDYDHSEGLRLIKRSLKKDLADGEITEDEYRRAIKDTLRQFR